MSSVVVYGAGGDTGRGRPVHVVNDSPVYYSRPTSWSGGGNVAALSIGAHEGRNIVVRDVILQIADETGNYSRVDEFDAPKPDCFNRMLVGGVAFDLGTVLSLGEYESIDVGGSPAIVFKGAKLRVNIGINNYSSAIPVQGRCVQIEQTLGEFTGRLIMSYSLVN